MKKNILKASALALACTIMFTVSGCSDSGGGGFSSNDNIGTDTISLILGEQTEVVQGDQIEATTGDTVIDVRYYTEDDRYVVVLESGSAVVVKNTPE